MMGKQRRVFDGIPLTVLDGQVYGRKAASTQRFRHDRIVTNTPIQEAIHTRDFTWLSCALEDIFNGRYHIRRCPSKPVDLV